MVAQHQANPLHLGHPVRDSEKEQIAAAGATPDAALNRSWSWLLFRQIGFIEPMTTPRPTIAIQF